MVANKSWVPIGKKVDLSREVEGILPVSMMDPTVQEDVADGYNLGTGTDGVGVLEGKDTSNQLAFFRLQAGVGATVAQKGNSIVISSSVLPANQAGVMLTTAYDSQNDGVVNEARLADAVSWSNVTGKPASYPPSVHTHAESDVVNLTSDLAGKVPVSRLINTAFSLQGGGPLSADLAISLIGDKANVGPDMRYGTNPSGNLGWYPASVGAGDMDKAVYDQNNNGIVDLAEAVTAGAINTAMLGVGCVTGKNVASATIPGSAFTPTAIADSLGYAPLNRTGDIASGQLAVNKPGASVSPNMYQNAHLLVETSGSGSGFPAIGFASLTGGANAGAVALYFQGPHGDFQLEYQDGTTAHLLSSISLISGSQLTAGSVPASALASGAAAANLGYTPIDGTHGGTYAPAAPEVLQTHQGIGAVSWSVAPLQISAPSGGGTRPQIGFYYPGIAASLYFEPTDATFRYVDSGGTVRILLDHLHGVSGAELQPGAAIANIGYTPINKSRDTMPGGAQHVFTSVVGANSTSWEYAPIMLYADWSANNGLRAGLSFVNGGINSAFLWLNTDGRLWVTDGAGNNHLIHYDF